MQTDLKHFAVLQKTLENERDTLRARLAEINAALGTQSTAGSSSGAPSMSREYPTERATSASRRGVAPGRYRRNGKLTMREAIAAATAHRPLGLPELVTAVKKGGYQFTSRNPKNSLGAYLYGPGKAHFKKVNGGFAVR